MVVVLLLAVGGIQLLDMPRQAVAAEATPACAGEASSRAEAVTLARQCGRLVEDLSARRHDSQTLVKPDGTHELHSFVQPRWAQRADGSWAAVDTALRLVGGRVVPGNTVVPVSFSAGGSGPLATIGSGDAALTFTWPAALPTGLLAGDSITYPNVFPDVDLRLTANAKGFSEVLIVKTPAAATHPGLASVRLGYSSTTLRVTADGDGAAARDNRGQIVYTSPQPLMWDSSGGAGSPSSLTGVANPTAVLPKIRPMAVQIDATGIAVIPDRQMFTEDSTLYPVFVDPSWSGGIKDGMWKNVASRNDVKDSTGFTLENGAFKGDAGAGRTCDGEVSGSGVCPGRGFYEVRSLFRMNTEGASGQNVIGAHFHITQKWASTCSPASNARLWLTTDISAATSWNNQPVWGLDGLKTDAEANYRVESGGSCRIQAGDVDFDATAIAQRAINAGWSDVTVGLQAIDEGTMDHWKRFDAGSASLVITFNRAPSPPVIQPHNTADCYKVCASTTPASTSGAQTGGWWKLDETSGTTAADSSPAARSMTGSGSLTWTDGGVRFDGSTGSMHAGLTPMVDTTKSFTVSAWAKRTSGGNADLCKFAVSQDANWLSAFWLGTCGSAWEFGRPSSDGSGYASHFAQAPMALDTWTHLVGLYDLLAGELRLYKDGALAAVTAAPAQAVASAANGSMRIGLGKHNFGPYGYFAGAVDNVQLYPRVLRGGEVSTLFAAGRAGGALTITPAEVRTTTPTLSMQVSDPDSAAAQVWTEIEVRTAPTDAATVVHHSPRLGSIGSGGIQPYGMPAGLLANGTTYYWRAFSSDEMLWNSYWTPFVAFKVDTSAPVLSAPAVTSSLYPHKQWGAVVGTPGTFVLSASSADTAEFEWWVDNGPHTATAATGSGPRTASVTWTPSTDMVHTLNVKAKDNAGNVSASTYLHQMWVDHVPARCFNWRMDETTGATAADSGNTDNNDVLCAPIGAGIQAMPAAVTANAGGTTGWTSGHIGGGLNLSGTGGQATTSTLVLDTSNSFTVMAWAKMANLAAGNQTLLSQAGTNVSGFQLQYRQDANGGAGGFCMSMRASDANAASLASACATLVPQQNQWVHLAGVYNESTATLRVYVMGDPFECGGNTAATTFTSPWSAGGALLIGRAGTASSANEYWIGTVDDVYAFPRALPSEDICQRAMQ